MQTFFKSWSNLIWLVLVFALLLSRARAESPDLYFSIEPSSEMGFVGHFSDDASLPNPSSTCTQTCLPQSSDRGSTGWRHGTLLAFFGVDGSKQPQDFGANAHLGLGTSLEYAGPLIPRLGIGFQLGNRTVFQGNAVQVFELLGESKDRFQNFTTVGVFQRLNNGFSFGGAYDFLSQESFDNFSLGQWRVRASVEMNEVSEIGVTLNFSDRKDTGRFNSELVQLEPIEQLSIYWRRRWQTGAETTFWLGVADGHSEENVITGTLPPKTNQILFGSEIHLPLNRWLAIYGETNVVMPADTGAVDAYLGLQFAPQGVARSRSRGNRFRSLIPVASSPTFTTDLNRVR